MCHDALMYLANHSGLDIAFADTFLAQNSATTTIPGVKEDIHRYLYSTKEN